MNWLVSLIVNDLFKALTDWVAGWIKSYKDIQNTHAADDAKSQQDTSKLQKVTPTTNAKDTSEAIDDSLNNL